VLQTSVVVVKAKRRGGGAVFFPQTRHLNDEIRHELLQRVDAVLHFLRRAVLP
jgi:hypothetical protein